MLASFNLTLDVQPPASPAMSINDGATVTGVQAVVVTLTSADVDAGARDVASMKIWGDVQETADPGIRATEADAEWLPYVEQVSVYLHPGAGRKTLYARLRDDVGNESPVVSDFIDLDLTTPAVEITTAISRGKVSKVSPYDAVSFSWVPSSMAIDAYEVRVVPSHGSPHQSGVALGAAHGSINTSGTGPIAMGEQTTTTVNGADLEAASPGSTSKVIKVFVRSPDGVWSA